MKKFINKYKNYILSFMIPVIILIISFGIIGYYPFGDKLVAIIDGYSQYPGLLSNFLNTIKGNNNLFYSFKGLVLIVMLIWFTILLILQILLHYFLGI